MLTLISLVRPLNAADKEGFLMETSYRLMGPVDSSASHTRQQASKLLAMTQADYYRTQVGIDVRLNPTCNSSLVVQCPTPNTTPRLVQTIPPQSATIGQALSLAIAGGTFTDTETPDALTISVSGLPVGLVYTNGFITGTASTTGMSTITVTATDPGSLSVSTGYTMTVAAPVSATLGQLSGFTITGVQPLSCVVMNGGQRAVTFQPQYGGGDGQPITFGVVNERAATTDPGPYTLNLYTDNPVIILNAQQGGTVAPYRYHWLGGCTSSARLGSGEAQIGLQVRGLGNPVEGAEVAVEVRGAQGQPLRLQLTEQTGRIVREQQVELAGMVEVICLHVGTQPAGVLLLRVSTPSQTQMVKMLKR